MFLPIIIADDGRTYTNVSYKTYEDAENALREFCETFTMYHDDKIVKAFVAC